MSSGPRHIPDALLERYLTDALQAQAKAGIEATLATSPADQARLEELRADSAAFLLQRPTRIVVERFEKEQRRARRWRWPLLLAPALAAVALLLIPRLPPKDPDGPITVKGSVILALHRKAGSGSVPVSPEVPLVPGDSLRFEVKAPANGFIAVVSKDSSGAISVYYPYGSDGAAPYDATQPLLPGAIELDATLGREDVYALHSTQPFELAWARKALEEGRPLEKAAPRGVSVGHAFFTKRAAP
jgi:hypothetical protein